MRTRLPALTLAAAREAEIVEELAIQMAAVYERARANGASETDARHSAEAEVPDWPALARMLARQLELEHPATNSGDGGSVRPLHDVPVGTARPMLLVLLGAWW